MLVRRAADRFVSEHDGVRSLHCFSAGQHYDAENVSFGPVIAVDEHDVAPGAGFDWHAHRGVAIASWVLEGSLLHEDGSGTRVVRPGELFVQVSADGLRHRETNASDSVALRFVQTTLVGDAAPVHVEHASCEVRGHAFVARGDWFAGGDVLAPGDSLRTDGPVLVEGFGELVVVDIEPPGFGGGA
jgi:quercetin 2,3-dioxygenase